jgi:TonB family protein
MNRLQKKCFIASTGLHLLLALILLIGPGFLSSKNKADDLPVLDFIPITTIEKPFSNPGAGAVQPPPAPQPQPPTALPKPLVQPAPKPEPVVKTEPVKPKPDPESLESAKETKPHREFTETKRKTNATEKPKNNVEAETRAREMAAAQRRREEQVGRSLRSLRGNLSSTTTIEMPEGGGGTGEAYANYAQVVKSIYTQAWLPPEDTASDDANVKVTVTILNDGTVESARILDRSGDAQVDRSIQRTLDTVTFIAPFPKGVKEKKRTYNINFNLKAKRMIG